MPLIAFHQYVNKTQFFSDLKKQINELDIYVYKMNKVCFYITYFFHFLYISFMISELNPLD